VVLGFDGFEAEVKEVEGVVPAPDADAVEAG